MEIKLDVLVSICIKQRKPWPRISWLGQEKEAIFLIDDKCISEINLVSGKTKKIPRLQSLLKNVVVLATSRNGAWLAGILTTGELFLWNKDLDHLKIVPAIKESSELVTAAQECSMRLYLYVSGDGNKVLLTTSTACIFLWESTECKNISSSKNPSLAGRWSQIVPEESVILPSSEDKETGMNADFNKNEILGDCCLCSFVFYSGECLMLTFLALQWHENSFKYISSLPYQILWAQQACSLPSLIPECEPVKSRGALLTAFSRDRLLLAVAINQNDPKATQILFINTLNFVTVSGSLKGCSSKNHVVPSKFVRSYWVGDMSWTPDSLFLACMLKRGSLILLTCMGELLTMVTSGCSIEFGPAEFIPFHPLITYRPQKSASQDSSHSFDSSASESDFMRQRFSVTSHSRLPYLIVSDGYMVTVLKFSDNLLPSGIMRSLLLDSAQRLEKIRQHLMTPKSKVKRLQLQSLSSLKASLLRQHRNQNSILSTIPKFLQEETAELSEKAADLQDYEDESDDEKQFQNNSSTFCSQRPDSFFSRADRGRLEFASMFDTVHAKDDTDAKDDLSVELNSIEKNLLAAWGIGISKNVQEKDMLLNYTVGCITHFFNILQFLKSPLLNDDGFLNKSVRNNLWMHCILKHFQQYLTVLYWDVRDRQAVGHLVKLTSQTVKLMLIQQQDQLFSKYLLGCFCLLKLVAHNLSGKFTPHYEIMSISSDVNSTVELDSLVVPIFQVLDGSSAQKFHSLNALLKIPPQAVKLGEKPENRLMILWRLLYKQVLWYQTQLKRKISKNGKPLTEMKIVHEESIVAPLLGHIQAVLQSSGETLEQTWKLNSVIGEEQFLLGSYEESVDLWKKALQETKPKGEKRTQFLQTRYYLAILYCHLYHYNLSEAQGLSDHLVREILRRSRLSVRQMEDFSDAEYSQHELCMIRYVHPEAAVAVIQSMARFMAAYFTNQLLYILPPHNVDILSPLHINRDRFPRVVPLQHSVVTSAVRDQNLSSVWTAEYALDLLFVGGLIPEAVWLAHKLGDWKMSVSIGVAYNLYCQCGGDFSRSEKTELHLPLNLTPTQTFQEKLQSFLGQPFNFETSNEGSTKYKKFTDPIEEEDANVLFGSVQEILKAAVMADADILSETFQLLIDSAKDLTRKLSGLVPDGLYLPAPPLYCPQPASLSEEDYNDSTLKIERDYRQKVSGVLQRILLLFQAAHCSYPVAQWYIVQLKWARKVMQKIRMKGTLPSLSAFPETLLHYSKFSTIFFRPASSGDHRFDDVSCKTIGCFRELCALCWMLHVREKLSDSCRRYQTARESVGNQKDCKKTEFDACIVEHCLNAVEWACRMLPFARFMNVEELIQDIILSLVGELPPIRKVAEILVKAFPNPEDVRVPLRDKHHALQQRLRHCIVRGPKSEEMMSVVIQATHKVRLKVLKRVIRNIGPIEMSIWEPSEEETPDDEAHCYDRFSLGTSLSRSTLSDCGNPQVYSDAETADTLSEALLTEETRDQAPSSQRETRPHTEELTGSKDTAYKIKYLNWKAKHKEKEHNKDLPNQHTLPVVGAWEFERDDDEYVKFLDLFLSYMLERDFVNCSDPGIPFLTSFSKLLKEHELHSLLFDVHTTLKRRQGKICSQNVFRAGCCYAVTLASCDSKPASLCNEKQKCLENQMSVSVLQPADSSVCDSVNGVKKYMGKKGLFGLNHLSVYKAQNNKQEITITPVTQTLSDHACSILQTPMTCKYMYKTIHVDDVIPREELGLELKNKFSNIARLLEWMIRWSDKRLLCDTNKVESFQESHPMMHVKTSAAAILTSLWLLGRPYCDELQARNTSFKSPDYQYLKNSASLPETRPKIQKESSVDTDYSPSTETSHAVQDVNAYDEPCENLLGISTKTKHSEKNEMNESYSVTLSTEEGVIDFDEEVGTLLQEEVDVTSENEELSEEPFGAPKSPSISVSIKPVQQQKEEHISTLDVECPWEEPMMENLEGKKAKQNNMTEAVSSTIPHSFCLEMNADAPSNREICICDDQSSFTAVSSVPYNAPVCSKKQEVQEREPIAEPLNVSEAVRPMLQDEMFKLVQLQQINFLSLMQMVGSSFPSLPNMQHLLQQSQSIQLGGSQALHTVRGSGADTSLPTHSTDISPETQLPTRENAAKSDKKNSSHSQERNILNDQSNKESIHNHPDVNISLSLSETQSNGTGFIPASQDLLPSAPAKPLYLLYPSLDIQKTPKLIPVAKTLNYENGFPLLKLESDYHLKPLNLYPLKVPQAFIRPLPQPRVAWGPSNSLHNPPLSCTLGDKTNLMTHLNLNKYDPEMIGQVYEEKKRWAEAESKGPPKLLNLDQYEGEQNLPPLQYLCTNVSAEKPLGAHHASFCGTYQHSAGIPLLRLQLDPAPKFPPITRPPVAASLIPVRPMTEETNSRDTLQHTGISVLHTNLPPKNKFQPPQLIPLQNLIAFEQSRQCTSAPHDFIGQAHSGQIELLKANTEPFEARHTKNNTKRQRRQAEKQIKEKDDKKKASVTFRPDDSIIGTDDMEKVFEIEIQDQQAESSRYLGDDFVISLDTVGEAITTSASLHCMASARKKPTEIQDASTNTDPVLKSYQDIETGSEGIVPEHSKNRPIASVPSTEHLASNVLQMLPPDMYLNLTFHTEGGEKPLPSSVSDTAPDVIGHKYINVIDIEDSDLLKDLPVIAESTEEIVATQQSENFEVQSSAKLHHMAASVTNAIPPNEFQRKDDYQNVLFPLQEGDIKSDAARDDLTWNLLHEDVSIIHSTGLSTKIISKESFCTKLQEMDIQLQALQNIAENMEKDFSNTKLIVKKIEDLEMAASTDLGAASLFSENVGVIDEARYVSCVGFEDLMDEEEEGSKPEYSLTSYTALQAHSLSPTTSAANLSSRIKSSSDIHRNEDLGDSFIDDPLQITGLSGITDIINDLVTEGGVSATELGFTETQSRKISRIHDTAAGHSQKTEKERKEIQAWMKRKRKERLAEYLKKLDEQRESEYNPFNLRNNMQFGLTAKEIKLNQKKKDEKNKALLSENHNLRVSQALSLMNEMLFETVQLPASELRPLSKTMRSHRKFRKHHLTSARRNHSGIRSLSTSRTERSRTTAKPGEIKPGEARPLFTPPHGLAQSGEIATVVLQKTTSKGRIRNATSYPINSTQVAIQPQDQTSQVTRKGMLRDFNQRRTWLQGNASQRQGLSKRRPNSARQASDYQTNSTGKLRRPAPYAAAIQTKETGLDYETERDSLSPWSVPDDIQRLLHDNYDSLFEGYVPHEEHCSPLSTNDIDRVSESTGSILSKLDWKAVEAMVANVEEK
ncbi:ciliogenesis and planar polarity effector 1 [Emydura macquarii macquarii]|uniref:ciliogenesis and planar polarity effector 1 n=1 Tax=Emydura macquarii macquarii TaxID=1129001 RepID=UPI003529EEFB